MLDPIKNFNPAIPAGTPRIYNLSGSSAALLLCVQENPFLAVEQTEEAAVTLHEEILFFRTLLRLHDRRSPVFFLPDPDGPEASGKRAEVISAIGDTGSLVVSVQGMSAPVWSREAAKKEALLIQRGQEIEREAVAERLRNLGYKRVSIVVEKGEYCLKGWLLDVFPSTAGEPVRIEFFGDEIEHIKIFDLETQRSIAPREDILLLPADERAATGHLLSVVHAQRYMVGSTAEEEEGYPVPVFLSRFSFTGEGTDAGLLSMGGCGVSPDERKSFADFSSAVKRLAGENRVLIVAASPGQADRVRDILFEGDVIAPVISPGEVADYAGRMAITTGSLSAGLFLPGLLILTEHEIFGERPVYRPMKKSKVSGLLTTMDDIAPGDFVVHKDHGIGRFIEIRRQHTGEFETDAVILEYTGGDRLYIPLYNIDRIKKYGAEEGVLPHLDKLGGKTWQRTKEKVRKAVKEMAEKLLRLYAEREVARGVAFSPDAEIHREFYGFFPYEETPDQIKVFEEIGKDMESERPMERLLCGDVGYGKTEVAMRAAFKAVYDGKQVAVLVPTTILCEQHFLNFTSRFSAFPVKVDYLSRFKPKKEQDLTLRAVAKGETDIIIGTHGLLRKDVSFHDLGLLIVDEEHRFGVGQKEKIKELKRGVDVLIMTATPIPRTLQMALSGIRAMSLIETPPEERLAVRSIVSDFREEVIKEAIERELGRGGQVLFVHNTIFDIEKIADMLKRIQPKARTGVAHGRMAEKSLEDVMHRFLKKELDILLSTNIIGAGIDIPTANTILIDKADKMGLADLYQLRGRVGRSNVRAYAYFLIPGEDVMTDEAKKRLQAMREMSFLGAGFRLAMKDMEIRGAGNLLGPQQSGHIHAVGFDMYVEMLEKAVAEAKGEEVREEVEPTINLKCSAFIPETYIEDVTLRLSIYRRIAGAKEVGVVDAIETEMADRFGDVRPEVRGLLEIMRLKIMARQLRISTISESDNRVRFVFSEETPVAPEKIFGLQKTYAGVRFHKDGFELSIKGPEKDRKDLSVLFEVMKGLS